MNNLKKLSNYFWSLYYLKPSQIYWRMHREIKIHFVLLLCRLHFYHTKDITKHIRINDDFPELTSRIHSESIDLLKRRFTFLHEELELSEKKEERIKLIKRQTLLWQFHFHYHDYLISLIQSNGRDNQIILAFMEEWDDDFPVNNPESRKSAWHPYVLSMRIEAWIRIYIHFTKKQVEINSYELQFILKHLVLCGRVLYQNLEYGTLANHLFRNIKGLILLGSFIESREANGWYAKGLRLLDRELNEQILDDGAHFELSPMYHLSVMNDLLDIIEIVFEKENRVDERLLSTVRRMLQFLKKILHPDNEYPFLNDSTLSSILHTGEVIDRSEKLLTANAFNPNTQITNSMMIRKMRSSGLHIHRTEKLFVVFDGGQIGPDYQPGHAHADTLGFELSWNGRRIISDTGVYHYKFSDERKYSRSTAAHSTISIDNQDQSEVWDNFRVGRRAKIVFNDKMTIGGYKIFQAAHDGYTRIESNCIHERAVIISKHNFMIILDWIHGSNEHFIQNYIHFHPYLEIANDGEGFIVQDNNIRMCIIQSLQDDMRSSIITTPYFPAFGKSVERTSILFEQRSRLPVMQGYIFLFENIVPILDLDMINKKLHIRSVSEEEDISIGSLL